MPDRPRTHQQKLAAKYGLSRKPGDRLYDRLVRRRRKGLELARRIRHTQRWVTLSKRKLRRTPLCELCSTEEHPVLAEQVDHVVSLQEDPALAYSYANLQSLCTGCHATKSAQERRT